jgi:hypothetical protein
MKRWVIVLAALAGICIGLPLVSWAQFNGCAAGFCSITAPAATTTFSSTACGTVPCNNGETLSNGNLTITHASTSDPFATSVAGHSSGKYYFEITMSAFQANSFGIIGISANTHAVGNYCGQELNSASFASTSGVFNFFFNGSPTALSIAFTPAAGNVIAQEVDLTGLTIKVNNVTRASGWSSAFSLAGLTGTTWYACAQTTASGDNSTANFGGSAYTGTPESGYGNW